MGEFSLHEIAVGQNFINRPIFNDMECEIVGELKERTIDVMNGIPCEYVTWLCYEVVFSNGYQTCVEPIRLRKKKPPQELGRWEDVEEFTGWKPNKITVPKEKNNA